MSNEIHLNVLNLGAGIQSSTLYLMFDYDVAIFANTGEEPKSVYSHLEWLKSTGRSRIDTVSVGQRLGDNLIVGLPCKNGSRFASIPAYTATFVGSRQGITKRQCTADFKSKPIQAHIRSLLGVSKGQKVPATATVTQAFGISVDESSRAERIRRNWKTKWSTPSFPLLDLGMSRKDCEAWLVNFGVPHKVQRSSCVFCPYRSNAEWNELRKSPEDFSRAVEIDKKIRGHGARAQEGSASKLYVHRSCVPLDEIEQIDLRQGQFDFHGECEGGCGL